MSLPAGRQAGVGAIYMARRGFVFNNSVGSVNLFRFQQLETYQCRS